MRHILALLLVWVNQAQALPLGFEFRINQLGPAIEYAAISVYAQRATWLREVKAISDELPPIQLPSNGYLMPRLVQTPAIAARLLTMRVVTGYTKGIESQFIQTNIYPAFNSATEAYFTRFGVSANAALSHDPIVLNLALKLMAKSLQGLTTVVTTADDQLLLQTWIAATGRAVARSTSLSAIADYNEFLMRETTIDFMARLLASPITKASYLSIEPLVQYFMSWGAA